MNKDAKILECIPNFSEGVNTKVIDAIAQAIRSVDAQQLLHIDQGPAANRTVMTFAGAPKAVVEAALRAIKVAAQYIDMMQQHGEHPRVGATDVCPLVPLQNMTMEEAVYWSEVLAQRVATEIGIPVFLYEHSAKADYRRALPDIRKGQYEGIFTKMKQADWQPDYGSVDRDNEPQIKKTGVTIIGARDILVAFNISLDTQDETIAMDIAKRMRSSGYFIKDDEGKRKQIAGMLPKLRAIGWYMSDFKAAQVSMNLIDYRITAPLAAWQACKALAVEHGVSLTGCEVVGLIPLACVTEAGKYALKNDTATEQELVAAGIAYLKLDGVKPFNPQEKILEYVLLEKAGVALTIQ